MEGSESDSDVGDNNAAEPDTSGPPWDPLVG